jgi:hypothetical protein
MRVDGFFRRLFRRRARKQLARELAETKRVLAFIEQMREGGYQTVIDSPPSLFRPIEAVRIEWGTSRIIVLNEQRPEFNIAGLYWREVY